MSSADFFLLLSLHNQIKMLKFLSLGSGSSGNCYLLLTENDGLMIDAGIGTRRLKKYLHDYGVPLVRIHRVLVTHDHADHVKSIGALSRAANLPVYTTEAVHGGIDGNYCVKKKIPQELRHYLNKGESATLGDFQITSFQVPHDSTENVGYEIRVGDAVFCLITDAGHVTEEMAARIARANYLVLEANYDEGLLENGPYPRHLKSRISSGTGHLSNTNCGLAIVENWSPALRRVWLCHLSAENNQPTLALETVIQVLNSHGIDTTEGVQVEVLNRTSPTGFFELNTHK